MRLVSCKVWLQGGLLILAAASISHAQPQPNNVFCSGTACTQPPAINVPGSLFATGTLQNANVPGLVLYNSAGLAGTSMSIDFYDYTVPNSTYSPQARIMAPDSSDYSANIIFLNKVPGNSPPASANPLAESMRIASNGSVGIGTGSIGTGLPGGDLAGLPSPPPPNARIFEVNGDIALAQGTGGQMFYSDGTVQATAWNGVLSGGDYAESVNVSGDREKYEPGDVLVIDPDSEGNFLKSSAPYSSAVTGIYSTKPGVVGRRQLTARTHMKEEVPMAMTGIVPTKVSAENGSIKPGDLLVTSSKRGYAMKGTDRTQMLGAVIGKAIGHLDSGTGVIEAVVTLQ